ncbi:MAG: family 10 glycosylhydrolase [Acidobacteria bacterium]|nr:family 10 glycosylhydrolase [Acidobacteriota bacterium]
MHLRKGLGCQRAGFCFRLSHRLIGFLICAIFIVAYASGQTGGQYRAFWVDTFNTPLNNHNDIVTVVNNARMANANAILAQVRRRGDSWYLNSLEPSPDFIPIAPGFDPLQDLINEAHSYGIEVHAFVIVCAVWNKNPNFAPSPTLGPPTNPNHIFNSHGGYDPVTRQIVPGPDNWLTRTLLPDGTGMVTFQGHRIGPEFWMEPGHPDAAAFTVDVLMHLVRNYDLDGLHLDRIRYPEISIGGQTPSTGANIGYNDTNVTRFQRRNGIAPGSPPPVQNDPLWTQWRRDQVSNLVRRIYLNTIALKPHMNISAALIAFGGGPTTEASWNSAEAYWRVYQDWRAWTEEGILDIAMPMNYKRENLTSGVAQFDQWIEWSKNHQYNRAAMIGVGSFLNSIEGTLRQTRRALSPSTAGNSGIGAIFFSMATSNIAVPANPHSIPPGLNTPARAFAEFSAGLTTGRSLDGSTLYEDPATNPTPVFSKIASVPILAWKAAPERGHLMGFARRSDGTPLDSATVTIENLETAITHATSSDGGGFYGGVDLTPGQYLVRGELGGETLHSCVVSVTAGTVANADLQLEIIAPITGASISPPVPNGSNGWYISDVSVSFNPTDNCSGVARTEFSTDGGITWQLYSGNLLISAEGMTSINYRSIDRAGNVEAAQSLTIKLDKTAPTISLWANPSVIWPPNGKTVEVAINGQATDSISGLERVNYVVTDEYGSELMIAPRRLSGYLAEWIEQLAVEARRDGNDHDGRLYQVVAIINDAAGNAASATVKIVVLHDRR